MGDERIEARPLLGGEEPRDGGGVGGVGGEAIDGFGRQDGQIAGSQRLGRAIYGVRVAVRAILTDTLAGMTSVACHWS